MSFIVLCAAIVVLFSQEFASVFKKIFAIPGVKLFLPLFVVSLLVEYYQAMGIWFLLFYKDYLHIFLHYLVSVLPFAKGAITFVHILYLFVIACVPIWILYGWAWHKKRPKPWTHAYQLGFICWLTAAVLLTVHSP
jgi:hypothetical protein